MAGSLAAIHSKFSGNVFQLKRFFLTSLIMEEKKDERICIKFPLAFTIVCSCCLTVVSTDLMARILQCVQPSPKQSNRLGFNVNCYSMNANWLQKI